VGKKAAEICKPIFSHKSASWKAISEVARQLQEGIAEFLLKTPN
jgi:hypothetical protein